MNKTLLLIKQQKWLSEFCVKIDRVASKNQGRLIADKKGQGRRLKNRVSWVTVNTHIFLFGLSVLITHPKLQSSPLVLVGFVHVLLQSSPLVLVGFVLHNLQFDGSVLLTIVCLKCFPFFLYIVCRLLATSGYPILYSICTLFFLN